MTANAMAKARRHVVRPDARSAPIFWMVRALATIAHIAAITFPVLRRARSLAHSNFGGLHSCGFVRERVAPSQVARFRLMCAAPVETTQEVAQFGLLCEVRGRDMCVARRSTENNEIMLTIAATAATLQTEPMVTRFALMPAIWVCARVDMI